MPESHGLWTAALDLRLSATDTMLLVTRAPERWDELLDTRLPLLISQEVGSWEELSAGLWEAGCPAALSLRLVESDGRVQKLEWTAQRLTPEPDTSEWTLALGWTHSDEGWRSRLPLWGRRYIVTRAAKQAEALVERLERLGAQALAVPTIAFTDPDDLSPWDRAVAMMPKFDWLLFTSPKGVDSFVQRLWTSGLDLRSVGHAKFGCIGPSTAKALSRHGLRPDLVPEVFVAEGLLAALQAELGASITGTRILLPRAQVARTVLPDALSAAGADVLVAPIYKTVPPDLASLPQEKGDLPRLLFTSSSTVENWVQATHDHAQTKSWPCYCIGPITADTARSHGLEILGTANNYTIDGLIDLLQQADTKAPL